MINTILNIIALWKPFIEILILWFVIYHIMFFFVGTRAINALRGIIVILVAFFLFQKLHFEVLDWLFAKLFGISVIAFMVIFHPELRQGLAKLGQRHLLFGTVIKEEKLDYVLKQVGKAVDNLTKEKLGAIIAIEKNDSLAPYIESGIIIDARVSSELIETIFARNSILHDGGMIIQSGRVMSAGCLFPLSENQDLSRIFGTRHRAALGLSEETDAVIIVVSEERQDIRLICGGQMQKDLSREELIFKIKDNILSQNQS